MPDNEGARGSLAPTVQGGPIQQQDVTATLSAPTVQGRHPSQEQEHAPTPTNPGDPMGPVLVVDELV
jgi:hypothetical protein